MIISRTYAELETESGHYKLTRELIGAKGDYPAFVVSINDDNMDISKMFRIDDSKGWETERMAFAQAAELYNKHAPEPIPTF